MNTYHTYVPSELVKILHAFPHFTFKFKLLADAEFDLGDKEYVESLVMVALFPVVLLGLSMLGFLIYYCCVKLKRTSPSKMKSSSCYCSVCLIVVFIMVALGGIGVIVYGTIEVHEGIKTATGATLNINDFYSAASFEVEEINKALIKIDVAVDDLNETMPNDSDVYAINAYVMSLQLLTVQLPLYSQQQEENNFKQMLMFLEDTELYRTIVTYSLIAIQGVICLFGLIGICFRSRCCLLTAVFTGLLCLVVSYLYIGTALMTNVATADICIRPYKYIQKQAAKFLIDQEVVDYYLACPFDVTQNPFTEVISNATSQLLALEQHVALEMAEKNFSDQVFATLDKIVLETLDMQKSFEALGSYADCKNVNQAISALVPAICFSTYEGIFILCMATLSVCFSLTIVLCAAPQTWKRFSKAKQAEDLDLDDVFLPPPARQPSVSRTNNPLYISPEERYSRRISSNPTPPVATNTLSFFRQSEENVHLIDQPPPAYSPPSPDTGY